MSVSLERNDELRRFTLVISGPLAVADVAGMLPVLREGAGRQYTVLWDAREASLRFEMGDLGRLQTTLVSLDSGRPRQPPIALVATAEHLHAFARAIVAMVGAAGYRIRAFKSFDEADRWLRDSA